MKTNDLRARYLDYFKSKAHKVFPSDSLVPQDDPSVLFTGAGMNQFKPYFLGLKKDMKRAASCQKCLRAADLDRVGKTAYHHTFFEMLGNFSFGDYFKEEAIEWGWEFVTKELKLTKEKLWVSVYQQDDEAFNIWKKKIGLPESRIVGMDAKDNFWPANAKEDGPNGPCGPCSEIYVGETPGKGVEIWNLVFTQYDRQSDGTLKDLPQKNIDTGMGLERTACVLQGVESNFDIDLFKEIRSELKKLLKNGSRETAHENAVMDHARAVVFTIADGVLPSNEGRGYVVRKLIRLGIDHLERAGAAKQGSFHKLVPAVIQVMKPAYPELASREKSVLSIVENEERSFLEVIKTRVPLLKEELPKTADPAEVAFKYYDTFGLPFELISATAAAAGTPIDVRAFNALLEQQKKRSRAASKISGEIFLKTGAYALAEGLPNSEFIGYEKLQSDGKLLRIIKQGAIQSGLKAGEEGLLIFDRTPFYAEAGGQIGDTGEVEGKNFRAKVLETQWIEKCIAHKVKVEQGEARCGESYALKVDRDRRADIMKNHTATHLLHSALRKVLGEHVKQSGSLVAPDRLRFDFTHFGAVEAQKLIEVENLVNEEIEKNVLLNKKILNKDEAVREGAIAFFGEKYGDEVRVVTIGDFSKELCGGTHLKSTGEIGSFKIISEGSIQAGVRRIEAVTGKKALLAVEETGKEMDRIADAFHVNKETLPFELKKLEERINASKNKMLGVLNSKMKDKIGESFKKASDFKGIKVVVEKINGADTALLKNAAEYLATLNAPFTALFSSESDEKVSFVVAASLMLVEKGFHSGKIVKSIALMVEGSGGGRPEFAVGGGKNLKKKNEAIEQGRKEIQNNLESILKGK